LENGLNGNSADKILAYLGPSLPLATARAILPEAIYKPPAKQGDIVSDLVNLEPNRIILIDGEFRGNLSPWHKEFVYALQYPGVKGVYGAASMGALRAAELDYLGMIGIGQIYEWYRDGVTEDDAEVALNYALHNGTYRLLSVPLVDIRAGVEHYEREFPGEPVALAAREFLLRAAEVPYMHRTWAACEELWEKQCGVTFPHIAQKELDAVHALNDWSHCESKATQTPKPEHLSLAFHALYERDRRIKVNGTEIPQQHVDAHVILHNPEYERICWDSGNQELALMLCNMLCVTVSIEEIERENQRFQARADIETAEDFSNFLENNGWSRHDYDRLQIQNARIRKLQHSLTVTKLFRRNTQAIIDYMRTHQAFDYWAVQAARIEKGMKKTGVDDWLGVEFETPAFTLLQRHFDKEGLELNCMPEEYLLETGFTNLTELSVALTRTMAGKEQEL
jgi:hypothetical protein